MALVKAAYGHKTFLILTLLSSGVQLWSDSPYYEINLKI